MAKRQYAQAEVFMGGLNRGRTDRVGWVSVGLRSIGGSGMVSLCRGDLDLCRGATSSWAGSMGSLGTVLDGCHGLCVRKTGLRAGSVVLRRSVSPLFARACLGAPGTALSAVELACGGRSGHSAVHAQAYAKYPELLQSAHRRP